MILRVHIRDKTFSERISGRRQVSLKPGINISVGPNGSGKSSFIRMIQQASGGSYAKSNDKDRLARMVKCDGKTQLYFYDSERNLRNKTSFGNAAGLQVLCKFRSHGEACLLEFEASLGVARQTEGVLATFLIDEPENGLDVDGIQKFVKLVKDAADDGCQFCIATHHPLIWTIPGANRVVFGPDRGYVNKTLNRFRAAL